MESFIDPHEWVPIHTLPGFEACIEYYVNRDGVVKSTKRRSGTILKRRVQPRGYVMVGLTQRIGKGKTIYVGVHKLVAFAFLPRPPAPYGRSRGCSMIHFIDGDKSNCCASNLKWITRKEIQPHSNVKNSPKIKESLDEK